MNHIGNITLNSKVVLSDPCFDIDMWCAAVLDSVKSGVYNCYVLQKDIPHWGQRICELCVVHSTADVSFDQINTFSGSIGVDGGTAGIYDFDYYQQAHKDEYNDEWHRTHVTKALFGGDTYKDYYISENLGVLSTSGKGDGSYDYFIHLNEYNQIDAIKIVFINESDDSESD